MTKIKTSVKINSKAVGYLVKSLDDTKFNFYEDLQSALDDFYYCDNAKLNLVLYVCVGGKSSINEITIASVPDGKHDILK